MSQKPLLKLFGIVAVGLLLALIFLPAVAGLIEGDIGYLSDRAANGWNADGNSTRTQEICDIYAWAFWRIGIAQEEPQAYQQFLLMQQAKILLQRL
jgi:hypothetical protein